jgi:transcriptional regulator with XRE-family HTH domain
VGETRLQRHIREQQASQRRALAEEVARTLEIEGLSLRALGRATGVDPSQLSRFLRCKAGVSHESLVAIAASLGYDVSVRLFESTGPRIRDHIQARMLEALLGVLHPRWLARLEVAVHRPVRDVIDVVLQDRETWDAVAGEAHGELRTVERQLRWAGQKADALPSAAGWPWTDGEADPQVGRLLLLRSCAANTALVATLPALFRAAYPDPAEQAVRALRTGDRRWPGSAIVWVDIDGARSRVLDGVPRALPRSPRVSPVS